MPPWHQDRVKRGPPTLGDHDSTRAHLRGHCPACAHSSFIDVQHLVSRFGPAPPVRSIRPLLRCTGCGHRGAEVTIDVISTGPARDRVVVVDRTPPWSPLRVVPPPSR